MFCVYTEMLAYVVATQGDGEQLVCHRCRFYPFCHVGLSLSDRVGGWSWECARDGRFSSGLVWFRAGPL
jgi:hypothetical protein